MNDSLYTEWDPEVGRVAMMRGISRYDAIRFLEARDARLDAKYAAQEAADEARRAEIATQETTPITAEFAKKIARKFDRGLNKAQRDAFRACIGGDDKLWQRVANPQTRGEAIRSLSLAQARRFLGK